MAIYDIMFHMTSHTSHRSKRIRTIVVASLVVVNTLFFGYWSIHSRTSVHGNVDIQARVKEFNDLHTNSFAQVSDYFKRVANEDGGENAYEVLRYVAMPQGIDIHLLGHVIGDVLFKQQGIAGMKYCTQEFRNACSHTVVVGALLTQGLDSLKSVHAICHTAPGGSGAYTMCFHGLGHGVLAFNNYEFDPTVEICKTLGTKEYGNREYTECVGGAVMEFMGGGTHDPATYDKKRVKFLNKDDPLSLCRDHVPVEARPMCYNYLTPFLMERMGADMGNPSPSVFKEASRFCDDIPKTEMDSRRACFGGFGKEYPVLAAGRDIRDIHVLTPDKLAKIKEWCTGVGEGDDQIPCYTNALASLYWGGENAADVAITYCSLFKNGEGVFDRKKCFNELAGQVLAYKRDSAAREEYCSMVPEDQRKSCAGMLNLAKKN